MTFFIAQWRFSLYIIAYDRFYCNRNPLNTVYFFVNFFVFYTIERFSGKGYNILRNSKGVIT